MWWNLDTLDLSLGEGNGTPLQYSCLENPMDGGAWWAALHGVARSQTRLSDFTFTFHFQALEKEIATHSSILAWRIPGTGEPVFMGSHGVGHNWSDLAAAADLSLEQPPVTKWICLNEGASQEGAVTVSNSTSLIVFSLQTASEVLKSQWIYHPYEWRIVLLCIFIPQVEKRIQGNIA